jgi:hypothetical protein
MSTENEILEIESEISNVKRAIKRLDTLNRLTETPEWKELIEEGYLRDEAARVVGLRADIQMRMAGEVQMDWLNDMLTGIGAFNQYLNFIRQMGHSAKEQLEQKQDTHAELLREQMGGDQ